MNSNGFTARILDNGIAGLVDLRQDPEKFSYDRWAASLTSTTRKFTVDESIRVKLVKVDLRNHDILLGALSVEKTDETEDPG